MVPKAGNQFRLLPDNPGASPSGAAQGLAELLIERCLHSDQEGGLATLRASCVAVRIARHMRWKPQLLDILHLACLGRQDREENREAWSVSAHPALRIVVRQCDSNPEILALIRNAVHAEKLVRESGVYHGIDALMKQKLPESFLDAAWDLRYDGQMWLRLEERPASESLLHAGRLGLSPVVETDRTAIPLPRVHDSKAA